MSRTAAVTPAKHATAAVAAYGAAQWLERWLEWVAFKTILVSFGAFVVTSCVSLLGFLAVLVDQIGMATFLAPFLPLGGAVTAGTFAVAAVFHLGALGLRHYSGR